MRLSLAHMLSGECGLWMLRWLTQPSGALSEAAQGRGAAEAARSPVHHHCGLVTQTRPCVLGSGLPRPVGHAALAQMQCLCLGLG